MGGPDFLKPRRNGQEAGFQHLQYSGTTTTTCGSVNSTTVSGSTVTVELGHVNCDGSDITVTVPGVNHASGSVDASATMTLRTGDVNANGRVGTADLKEIRMKRGSWLGNRR
jgi:hypothetical protein